MRYRVLAYNTATASTNKIHDDAVARQLGFRGGLVPGVDVFAYLCHLPAERWGRSWLERGTISARFESPVYDGDEVEVVATEAPDGSLELALEDPSGARCATGRASLAAERAPSPEVAAWPSGPTPEAPPPATPEALTATPLGRVERGFHASAADDYLDTVREELPLFRNDRLAHPGWLLRRANDVLIANVTLGPWIHVGSDVTLLGAVEDGDRVETRALVTGVTERRGHRFVDLDVLQLVDDRPVARIAHTAIYRPGAPEPTATRLVSSASAMLVPVDQAEDRLVRFAAFDHLDHLVRLHGEVFSWAGLSAGFSFRDRAVRLLGPQGIFTPAGMPAPLSITTAPERPGRLRPYEDEVGPDGFLRYRYRGTDPRHRDNVGLRCAGQLGLPLVYFHGVGIGRYWAHWPVFIHDDDPASLTFTVAFEDPQLLRPDLSSETVDEARRAYVTRLAVRRLHQAAFRQRVLTAYRTRCAVCRLRHGELLDAAHILPDTHPRGAPVVSNGLALCKLHHAAFDTDILGVRPDARVEVREDVLEEVDGPMLRHGLQGLHGARLLLPHRAHLRPAVDHLEERYEKFRRAG